MRYFLIAILLLNCSGKSVVKVDPVIEPDIIQDTSKPSFVLALPFEGGSVVEPVESMPVWKPVAEKSKMVSASIRVDTTSCDSLFDIAGKRLNKIDSLYLVMDSVIDDCLSDTVVVQKIVHSRFLAYLMLVIGFVVGVFTVLILNFITRNRYLE